jgi:hypothetical protein
MTEILLNFQENWWRCKFSKEIGGDVIFPNQIGGDVIFSIKLMEMQFFPRKLVDLKIFQFDRFGPFPKW